MSKKFLYAALLILFTATVFYRYKTLDPGYELNINIGFLESIRSGIERVALKTLPEPQASFLVGILLGIKKSLPSAFYDALQVTGTLHVVVVSGFNVTLVGRVVYYAFAFLTQRLRLSFTVLGIFLFVALVGFDAPAVRAGIMGSIAFWGADLGRQKDALRALLAAIAIMLLINPYWTGSLGFQLSVLATLGLIIIMPVLENLVPKKFGVFREGFLTTFSAQLAVWPLIAYKFAQISILSVLVNTLVLWAIPLSTIFGFITTTLASIIRPIDYLIMIPTNVLLTYFVSIVSFFGRIEVGLISVKFSVLLMFIYYLLLSILIWFLYRRYLTNQEQG